MNYMKFEFELSHINFEKSWYYIFNEVRSFLIRIRIRIRINNKNDSNIKGIAFENNIINITTFTCFRFIYRHPTVKNNNNLENSIRVFSRVLLCIMHFLVEFELRYILLIIIIYVIYNKNSYVLSRNKIYP